MVGLPRESFIEDAQEEEIAQEITIADADKERRLVEGNIEERTQVRPRTTIVANMIWRSYSILHKNRAQLVQCDVQPSRNPRKDCSSVKLS